MNLKNSKSQLNTLQVSSYENDGFLLIGIFELLYCAQLLFDLENMRLYQKQLHHMEKGTHTPEG